MRLSPRTNSRQIWKETTNMVALNTTEKRITLSLSFFDVDGKLWMLSLGQPFSDKKLLDASDNTGFLTSLKETLPEIHKPINVFTISETDIDTRETNTLAMWVAPPEYTCSKDYLQNAFADTDTLTKCVIIELRDKYDLLQNKRIHIRMNLSI